MMEPIPVFFDFINRTALIVKPKQPFFNWLQSIDPDDDPGKDYMDDPDVYLLPDFEDLEFMEKWLKKNFDQIFCDQMNHWYTDEDLWIQNRTFKLFKEWFDYTMHTMIWDTLDKPVLPRCCTRRLRTSSCTGTKLWSPDSLYRDRTCT